MDSKMMTEEIFAPILPIKTFVHFDDVIKNHIRKHDKPLAIYYFGNKSGKNYKNIIENTSSGNVTANDILFQALAIDVGFGGVGGSGCGRYGGEIGFRNFSNPKSIVEKAQLNMWPITMMAPPWTDSKANMTRFLQKGLWIKQNATIYGAIKLIAIFIALNFMFGPIGDYDFRREFAKRLIMFLWPYMETDRALSP